MPKVSIDHDAFKEAAHSAQAQPKFDAVSTEHDDDPAGHTVRRRTVNVASTTLVYTRPATVVDVNATHTWYAGDAANGNVLLAYESDAIAATPNPNFAASRISWRRP